MYIYETYRTEINALTFSEIFQSQKVMTKLFTKQFLCQILMNQFGILLFLISQKGLQLKLIYWGVEEAEPFQYLVIFPWC